MSQIISEVHRQYACEEELQEQVQETVKAFVEAKTFSEFCEAMGVEPDVTMYAVWETLADVHNAANDQGFARAVKRVVACKYADAFTECSTFDEFEREVGREAGLYDLWLAFIRVYNHGKADAYRELGR